MHSKMFSHTRTKNTVCCIFVKVWPTNNEKVNVFGFSHVLSPCYLGCIYKLIRNNFRVGNSSLEL